MFGTVTSNCFFFWLKKVFEWQHLMNCCFMFCLFFCIQNRHIRAIWAISVTKPQLFFTLKVIFKFKISPKRTISILGIMGFFPIVRTIDETESDELPITDNSHVVRCWSLFVRKTHKIASSKSINLLITCHMPNKDLTVKNEN